jgi:hypothetical protein
VFYEISLDAAWLTRTERGCIGRLADRQLRSMDRERVAAAYVRALDLSVERLGQRYARVADDGNTSQYDYRAPAFDFDARLVYDEAGLQLDYPGIARRVL